VVIRIADCVLHGDVTIRRSAVGPDGTWHYGAMFYPASEADMLKLNGVLAGIEAMRED
jgi:hypothetical protein